MKVIPCSDYDEMSQLAVQSVLSELKKNPDQLLCPASGNSAVGVFESLAQAFKENPQNFKELRILMLDEWYGLAPEDPNSCEAFLQKHIIQPLSISKERYFSFTSHASDPERECKRMADKLNQQGPIDICILGIGRNGHIGFNEPADSLTPYCHVAPLSEMSKNHAMIAEIESPPEFGLTLGMVDILQAKKIILLLTGDSKRNVIEELLSKKITTQLPASLLWLHPNVECYLDRQSIAI